MTERTSESAFDLDLLLQGDHDAFEAMVRQESPRLFRMIARIVDDEEEAKNILQETFLQAYKRLDTFRGEAKITTWLYAIGINLARANRRKRKRVDPFLAEDLERLQPSFENRAWKILPKPWDPHKDIERSESIRIVREAIQRLPDGYKEIVTLRDIEEMDTSEVAKLLNISEGAVRVRLHRARNALRTLLTEYYS